jgi:nicotinamide-nucleotide amidase
LKGRRVVTAAEVLAELAGRGQTLAVAESPSRRVAESPRAARGLLAATIVDVPGASAAFRGGLVVYATDLKVTLAGVPEWLLAARGPVDPEVAGLLAAGARQCCTADWGLGTTGVAGSGCAGLPVGTAYVGLAGPDGSRAARRLELSGGRTVIRRAAVGAALALLAAALTA